MIKIKVYVITFVLGMLAALVVAVMDGSVTLFG